MRRVDLVQENHLTNPLMRKDAIRNASRFVRRYKRLNGIDTRSAMIDALVDLMHLADRKRLTWDELLDEAFDTHVAETGELYN